MQEYFNSRIKNNVDSIAAAALIYKNLGRYITTAVPTTVSKDGKSTTSKISPWKYVGRVMSRYGV